MSKGLIAKTHTPEYLIHKYWARKPANILRHYIQNYFKKGDTLVDPFCGSGVFVAEAKKAGMKAFGYDINPTAYLISDVTANPPSTEEFRKAVNKLLDKAKLKYLKLYKLTNGNVIRYLVHEVQTRCKNCNKTISFSNVIKNGKAYLCPKCNTRLSFNFEQSAGTKIIKIYDRENNEYSSALEIKNQNIFLRKKYQNTRFENDLVENRRILAFPGMKVSDLFTPRAFYVISNLFEQANKISNVQIRKAVFLYLTSGTAQLSRLIPYRNNLSTGGPAWTVPGFWIAPLHLETNPFIHLEARYKKMLKALEALHKQSKTNGSAEIKQISAFDALKKFKDNSIDGIFFDPPYGDNVPYMEFSAIWNSFISKNIKYKDEIVVSDRRKHKSSWDNYEQNINKTILLFEKKLKKGGKVVMTFNNLDPRAWKIVLESFNDSNFYCREAKYQAPAVVSSKAQKAANTSYVGDYYCVFEKTSKPFKRKTNLSSLSNIVKDVLLSRQGKAPKNLIHRMIILEILNKNLDLELFERIDDITKPVAVIDGDQYILRDSLFNKKILEEKNLQNILIMTANKKLANDKKTIDQFYMDILEATDRIGSPPLTEIKLLLQNNVYFDKQFCYLISSEQKQESLFNFSTSAPKNR